MSDINNIFRELKKRKVFRSLVFYAGASFMILQVCSIVFPALLLPDWSMRLVVVLLIIGFPTLIIFSWIYDVTPEGVIKTDQFKSSGSPNYTVIFLILLVVGGVLFYFQDRFFKPTVNPKSIAVLPFDNFSPQLEDEFLSDGFTEVIIANLAKVQDLMVISRTSIMRYKDTDMSLKEIAKELNVANILEGSIQRKGNKIRVVGQLIEAETDHHLWSETFDKDFNDIFSIQTSIAKEIASALKSQITDSEESVIEEKLTDNIEAYELYLKVKELYNEGGTTNRKIIKEFLRKIIDMDPKFAEAYALLSIYYSEGVHFGYDTSKGKKEKAKLFIDKAFSIKPDSPNVQFAYGYYYYGCYKDYLRALEHYQIAIDKEPGNEKFNSYMGYLHRRLGNWDKMAFYFDKAYKLNPNGPSLGGGLETYIFMKDYSKADVTKYYKKLQRIYPDKFYSYAVAANYAFKIEGNTKNARKIVDYAKNIFPDTEDLNWTIYSFDLFDKKYDEALLHIEESSDSIYFSQGKINIKEINLGHIYLLMGDEENAKSNYLAAMKILSAMDGYDSDPRYHSVLGLMHALLGDTTLAVKEAKMAVALYPVKKDAFIADWYEMDLARVYSILREYDLAMDIIERLLKEPSHMNWMSKYDILFNKFIGDNPRFVKLIKEDEEHFRKEAKYDINQYLPN